MGKTDGTATATTATSTTTTTGTPDAGSGSAATATTDSAPMGELRAKVAHGAGPVDIAPLVAANPGLRNDMIAYLQSTRGNAFVQQVLTAAGAVSNTSAAPILAPPKPKQADAAPPPNIDPLTGDAGMVAFIVNVDGQFVQVYVSPGGINHHPDVFMFFHGQRANLKLDKTKSDDSGNVSGNDVAGSAIAEAKAKNTIALIPQGDNGGGMKALEMKGGGLPSFLDDLLEQVADHFNMKGKLDPAHIALAGHSAGGYKGVHEALSTAGKYSDTISDITLMDTNYSESHFADASAWLFAGKAGKTLRIVQGEDQTNNSYEKIPDPSDPSKKISKRVDPYWREYFGEEVLARDAEHAKMTIDKVVSPTKDDYKGKSAPERSRGNQTNVIQHTQVKTANGVLQADILVMMSTLGHHEIRDNVMDDAIDSIGKGGTDSDQFGRNTLPQYGRDPNMPHHENAEGPFSAKELAEQAEERERERKAAAAKKKQKQQQP